MPTAAVQHGPDSTFAFVVKPSPESKTESRAETQVGKGQFGSHCGEWPDRAKRPDNRRKGRFNPGEQVVTEGTDKLQDKSKVELRGRKSDGKGQTKPAAPSGTSTIQGRARLRRRNESFATVYFAAGRDGAVHGRDLLVGMVAYYQLPVSALPQVDYPTIQVLTFYPGASPDVMASSVTAPLERQFGQVPGLNQMTSTSSDGCSVIMLQFMLRPEHRRGRAAGAGGDQRGGHVPAEGSAGPADLQQDQSGRCADSDFGPDLRDAAADEGRGSGRHAAGAENLAAVGRGLVSISGGQKPAVRVQVNPTALSALRPEHGGSAHRDLAANVNQAKGSFDGRRQAYTIGANDQLLTSDAISGT